MGYDQYDPNDPYSILGLGQQYNPSQGYPTKQVSDEVWDLIQPTPDYLIAQQYNALTPYSKKFSPDAFFAADPQLRGPLAEALAHGKGDTMNAYNYLQSPDFQGHLKNEIGRTEWDQLEGQGNLDMIAAVTPEEKDKAALDYYMQGLEGVMAAGAPTTQRNAAQYDWVAERMGGRPYPGAGQDYPGFEGAGFGGNGAGGMGGGGAPADPLAALAGAPQYGGGGAGSNGGSSAYHGGSGQELTTGFGQGLADVGQEAGPDRLDFQGPEHFAVIGGRRYAIPETMADFSGSSPAYQRALSDVLRQKQERTRQGTPGHGNTQQGGGQGILHRLSNVQSALHLPNFTPWS